MIIKSYCMRLLILYMRAVSKCAAGKVSLIKVLIISVAVTLKRLSCKEWKGCNRLHVVV